MTKAILLAAAVTLTAVSAQAQMGWTFKECTDNLATSNRIYPGKHPIKRFCPERARDGVGEMPFECYRKRIGHLLGRIYNLPLANNGHRDKVERWRGPIEICFSRLLLITMIWRPFRARRPGGRFPGLKPWAKIL
jgi:hypothetical protein